MRHLLQHRLTNDCLIHLAFLVWGMLAFYFYQERMYSDSGFYIAKVVHYETFWIELSRYILVFSEWLPLLLIKLGAGMPTVLIGYSLGHVLFFYACFGVVRYVYQHPTAGWLLLLIQTVGIAYGFCAPGFEFYYATALIVVWAVLLEHPKNWKNLLLELFLLFFIITSHQITAWLVGGILLLHLYNNGWKHWKYYLAVGLFILMLLGYKKLIATSYEQEKMAWFLHLLQNHNFGWDYYQQLLGFYGQYYKELWLLIILSLAAYAKQKKYMLLAGYLLFLAATQYIVSLSYTDIKHSRYQEQCYFPLIFAGCFPLVFDIQKKMKGSHRNLMGLFFFLLISYRFVLVVIAIEPFKQRTAYMHRLIAACQERQGHKFIVHPPSSPTFADMTFTFNMEVMLLSALPPYNKSIQVIQASEWYYNEGQNQKLLQDTSKYLFTYRSFYERPDSVYQHQAVNTQFFDFPSGPYRFLDGQAPLLSTQQFKKNITLTTPLSQHTYRHEKVYNLPITIHNNGNTPINAHQIHLAYHWWKGGESYEWEGIRTPIEIDLLPEEKYTQVIPVRMPQEKGDYQLQLDAIGQDSLGWLHAPTRIPIKIN